MKERNESAQGVHLVVKDDLSKWVSRQDRMHDLALGAAAQDIEMIAAYYVPVDTGRLARMIRRRRKSALNWEVRVDEDYAAYQERGMRADGSHRVRKYSRPGSGPHYLARAAGVVQQKIGSYFRRANAQVSRELVAGSAEAINSRSDVTSIIGGE